MNTETSLLRAAEDKLEEYRNKEAIFDVYNVSLESVDEQTRTIVYRIDASPWMRTTSGLIIGGALAAAEELLLQIATKTLAGHNHWVVVDMQIEYLRRFFYADQFWLVCQPGHFGHRMVHMTGFFYSDPETKKPLTTCRANLFNTAG